MKGDRHIDIKEIKQRFRDLGLTQEQVAETIGPLPTVLSFIFSNKVRPTQETKYSFEVEFEADIFWGLELMDEYEAKESSIFPRFTSQQSRGLIGPFLIEIPCRGNY